MSSSYIGKTIGLYGDSGSGKTTQAGELAKRAWKIRKKKTLLNAADRGGYDSIAPLERAGIMIVNELGPEDDPWIYLDDAASGKKVTDEIGLVIIDSGTSIGDTLLSACSHADFQIGQQKTQKFTVNRGKDSKQSLTVAINNEAHYGVVQGFMLDTLRKATWLTRRGIDVLWTFLLYRGEDQSRTQILGPKVVGKAMTPTLAKEFRYMFRMEAIPQDGAAPIHRLYLTQHQELAGLGSSVGNARYPLSATPLPPFIEPASLQDALDLIDKGQEEADQKLREELGL